MLNQTLKYSLPLIVALVFIIALVPGCKPEAPITVTATATTTATATATKTATPTPSATPTLPPKDKIVIGAARPLSGPLSFFEATAFGPVYKMWVDEVNAGGGIFVKEYNKKLPIELKIYDDTSDMNTMTR